PSDIRYLAIAESGLQNVVSPAGARGVWQFMKETAQHYGLTVNNSVDERYDIELATHAACKYLTFLNKKYKDWPLAAAAYNMGQGALDAELKQQQVESYFDLFLNEETSRYVFRILSYKLICEDPMQYGFYLRPDDLYPEIPVDTLRVDTNVTDMVLFAQKQGTTLKMIRNLNPHLRKSAIELKANESIRIFVPSLSQKAKPVQLDSTVFVRNLNE
ncbi:MAG: lytic transglycosylase domain-containing protein, partial [Bacteroidetes bacterium]|nr:lytic transglycosylase domain-containing protein [Bacteroidota bacterium]